ncbi:unnamed protein product [Linum trigynum]|uniref:Uncharacterized protein n=1 Tax=Linum trigynum TaxID=586398 RepID=A0AAV2GKA7_9ROSI
MERQRNLWKSSKTQLMMKDDHNITVGRYGGTNTTSTRSSWSNNNTITTIASSGGAGGEHHHHRRHHQQDCYLTGGGFSWPPRSYTCSFCKREFRSP